MPKKIIRVESHDCPAKYCERCDTEYEVVAGQAVTHMDGFVGHACPDAPWRTLPLREEGWTPSCSKDCECQDGRKIWSCNFPALVNGVSKNV